jgi:ATP-dependent Clp protease protease subunit
MFVQAGPRNEEESGLKYIHVSDFTEDSGHRFLEDYTKCLNSGQDLVPIVIDSYGGQVDALTLMIDLIKSSPIPCATICLGKAMSAGAILLSCGTPDLRFASPNSRIMVHNMSSLAFGKVHDIKVDTVEIERLQEQLFGIVDKNCKKKKNYFLNLLRKNNNSDLYLSPQEALKHGLIDHIKVPYFRMFPVMKSEIIV